MGSLWAQRPPALCIRSAVALRGRRPGAAAPPAPPARDCVPWIPDSMHGCAERLARMLTGNVEPASFNACFGIPYACADGLMVRQASLAGGLGAGYALSGEREGRSPLACV